MSFDEQNKKEKPLRKELYPEGCETESEEAVQDFLSFLDDHIEEGLVKKVQCKKRYVLKRNVLGKSENKKP